MKAFWAVIGGVGAIYVLFPAHAPDPSPEAVPAVAAPHKVTPVLPPVPGATTLIRAPDGHFYADAMVNGVPVHFVVDTGATTVALTRTDAQAAGLTVADADFTATAKGAGGDIKVKPVQLDRVALGSIEARQVDAAIVQNDMPVSLLGQSWLKNVGTVSISDNRMVLK